MSWRTFFHLMWYATLVNHGRRTWDQYRKDHGIGDTPR